MMARLSLLCQEEGKCEETNYLLSKWQTQAKCVLAFLEHRNKKNMSKGQMSIKWNKTKTPQRS